MRRCIPSVYLTVLATGGSLLAFAPGPWLATAPAAQVATADALYARRDDPSAARQAALAYQAQHRAAPQDFVAAWKLARACHYLGTFGPSRDRRTWLETGMSAATHAVSLNDARPEGHYWLAATMTAMAEVLGPREGLKYRTRIRRSLERTLAIDPDFGDGMALLLLGQWYHRVPGLFGGSAAKAERHLRQVLARHSRAVAALVSLGELYADEGHATDARVFFQRALEAPNHPEFVPEDRALKARARARLQTLARE